MRDTVDSGNVFEPKSVHSSYTINCDSTACFLFALDLINREIIWLNIAQAGNERIAGCNSLRFLQKYFNITDELNFYSFFKMGATELVSDSKDADIIVSDDDIKLAEGQVQIKTSNVEAVMKLIENK